MQKEREALKLALEALEYCWSDSYNTNGYKARELSNNAIIAIKEALAQPEQEPIAKVCHDIEQHIGWNPKVNVAELPEGMGLYGAPRPEPTAIGKSVASEEEYWRNEMLSGD